MSQSRKIVALLLLLALCTALCCSCAGPSVKGTWKLTKAEGEMDALNETGFTMGIAMVEAFGGSITMTFTDKTVDLSMSMLGSTEKESASYSVSGKNLIIDGETIAYSISGDTLKLTQKGTTLVLTKVK